MNLEFPIRNLNAKLTELRLDLGRLRNFRNKEWVDNIEQRIEEYEQAVDALKKANGVEQSESNCNLQRVSVRTCDLSDGDKLISKSGTKLIYRGVSKEHSWCVICEYEENTYSKNYPEKISRLKGERGYFEPCDLYAR